MEETKITETKPAEQPKIGIDRAEELVKQLQAENARMEANIAKAEKLRITEMLSGKSEAGQPADKPKEQTPEEYAQAALRGELNAK